jgi:hypothetical protein
MPFSLNNAAAKFRAASQRFRFLAAFINVQRLAVRAQAYEFRNRMRYGIVQLFAVFFFFRFKVPVFALIASTGTADLESLLG